MTVSEADAWPAISHLSIYGDKTSYTNIQGYTIVHANYTITIM